MKLFVDTSAWSAAFRRDNADSPIALELMKAIKDGVDICTTGIVLQELLQGVQGPRHKKSLIKHFDSVPLIQPSRSDFIAAAELRNKCRKKGIQVGTIDALLAQLCIEHGLRMLSGDNDFSHIAKLTSLEVT